MWTPQPLRPSLMAGRWLRRRKRCGGVGEVDTTAAEAVASTTSPLVGRCSDEWGGGRGRTAPQLEPSLLPPAPASAAASVMAPPPARSVAAGAVAAAAGARGRGQAGPNSAAAGAESASGEGGGGGVRGGELVGGAGHLLPQPNPSFTSAGAAAAAAPEGGRWGGGGKQPAANSPHLDLCGSGGGGSIRGGVGEGGGRARPPVHDRSSSRRLRHLPRPPPGRGRWGHLGTACGGILRRLLALCPPYMSCMVKATVSRSSSTVRGTPSCRSK